MRRLIQVVYGILNPLLLGVSTDLLIQYGPEDHSFPGTLAACDSPVALQLPDVNLLLNNIITARDWGAHRI